MADHEAYTGGLLVFYTATVFCLIAIMDNPYRGEISVSPEAFQLIYDVPN